MDNRMALYQNIVLSGGTTMLPGLATRLERDIKGLYLQHTLKVHTQHHAASILLHVMPSAARPGVPVNLLCRRGRSQAYSAPYHNKNRTCRGRRRGSTS